MGIRFFPRWAVPSAFQIAVIVVVVRLLLFGAGVDSSTNAPHLVSVASVSTVRAAAEIALTLYLVAMASQNVLGIAVMRGLGRDVLWWKVLVLTGRGSVASAPTGGPGIDLVAVCAALLTAGSVAEQNRDRRWIASVKSWFVAMAIGAAALAHSPYSLMPHRRSLPTSTCSRCTCRRGLQLRCRGSGRCIWAVPAGLLVRGAQYRARRAGGNRADMCLGHRVKPEA